jgi:tetratricopeptide (TPR) repeat protein
LNRDNALFLLCGILCGFIAAYMVFERMATIQPQPRIHGAAAAAGSLPPEALAGGAPAGTAPPGGGAPMAAVQQLREQVARNPEDADAVLQLANMNFDISNWSRAQELYEQYLALRPADADILSDLGICFRAQGQFDDALGAFEKALNENPEHWFARFNKTIVLGIDLGNVEAAEADMDRLRQLRPDAPELERLATELAKRRQG